MSPTAPRLIARRAWLAAGVAGVAGLAGLAWRLRHERAPDGADEAAADFWRQSFPTPGGGALTMASLRGRGLLLNFWGTWCPPCLREMPTLERFQRRFGARGWQVVGLAVDNEGPVRDFLSRSPVSYPIALAGFGGIDLSRRLGNDKGALPFTAVFDAAGRRVRVKLGETSDEELAQWAEST